jgi:hypothetical protein
MLLSSSSTDTVGTRFFQPLADLWPRLQSTRLCPELSDFDFLRLGVQRVLSQAKSGRDFLQTHAAGGGSPITVSHFFETLKSERRGQMCAEANQLLVEQVGRRCADPFAQFPECAQFDLYAGDGHSLQAAAHDPFIGEEKRPAVHFYLLNLRSRALLHFELAMTDVATRRKGEHDMHAIKRRGLAALRLGAPKGQKVMIVWDRAGIDFHLWHKAKESGIYFLSREKENMALEVIGLLPFDKGLPCNEGVLRDELVATSNGVAMRRVVYRDALSGQEYIYLSSNLKLASGLLVLLYKRRWDIEKVFDETENRYEEGQAWATSPTAKRIQAQMICLTHNLCLLLETFLEKEEQLRNELEIQRRAKRTARMEAKLAAQGLKLPFAYWAIDRLTQRGAKLIRWIRTHLYQARAWSEALALLRRAYATY